MKVVIINTLYTPNVVGGAERSVQFLAEALVKQDCEVVVVSSAPSPGTQVDWINGVKVYYVGLKNVYWPFRGKDNPGILKPLWHAVDTYNPWMAREVANILDEECPDVIHTNNLLGFSTLVWNVIQERGVPIVHTLRDYNLLCPRSGMFRGCDNCQTQCWDCKLYAAPRQGRSDVVAAVVGNSQFILNRHLEMNYFQNAAEKTVVYSAYQAKNVPEPRVLLKDSVLKIGYIGRLDPTKGVEFLFEALAKLPNKNFEFLVAGKGTQAYETHLREQFTSVQCEFLGFVKPEEFFAKIDLLVVPSLWHEPLPRTIFESYAHGIPVIGSNRGGIPEIVDIGETGFVFDPDKSETLVKALRSFTEQPEIIAQMESACLKKAALFEPETMVRQYLNIYYGVQKCEQSQIR